MKKAFKIIVCITVIFSLVMFSALSVSADNHDDVLITDFLYSGYSIKYDTEVRWLSDTNQQYVMFYFPKSSYATYHSYISAPSTYCVGDVVNLSGTFVLPYDANTVHFRFCDSSGVDVGGSAVNLSSGIRTISADGEELKLCDFKYSYTFTQKKTNVYARFTFICDSAIDFVGVLNMDFLLNNDPQVAMKQQTDELKANQDKNSAAIQQNQDKNTDKILNGDEDLDTSEQTGAIDGTVGGIDDATSDALGGKSDAEIQAEIDGALSGDIGLDMNKAGRISGFFDDLLDAFGADYKSLVLLSLSLGLAAFLIGRRYA